MFVLNLVGKDDSMNWGMRIERNECMIKVHNMNWAINGPISSGTPWADEIVNSAIQIVNNSGPTIISECDVAGVGVGGGSGSHGLVSANKSTNIFITRRNQGSVFDKFAEAVTEGGHTITDPPFGIISTWGSIINQSYDWDYVHSNYRSLFKFYTISGGIVLGHYAANLSTSNPPHGLGGVFG